ncbi:MAG: D-glycero-beta-D-manno-heptose 1-phosphate adenylyltransferase [Elusimicrobia bacterium HGW-Elusimicrobia-3]|jgi:D-beta-D-heptose 7-phosphate kinase/D-beta-D-heptose 1-phosphate adenosyltransferase|nr:MAG: D-glycero-beta-D-manno-heptose 1-phosphate adenylyltransferase [Elusimicrobia bacterium HGW-Elusimicrobia-3]
MRTAGKIVSVKRAAALRAALKKSGKTAVFTNGCFDLLHAGHVYSLEKARSLGDFLFLGLNSDASVRRLKGPSRPINKAGDRAVVLAALAAVDAVVVFSEDTPLKLIKALRPDILVKGADYRNATVVGAEYAGRVALIPLLKGRSTTGLAAKLSKK